MKRFYVHKRTYEEDEGLHQRAKRLKGRQDERLEEERYSTASLARGPDSQNFINREIKQCHESKGPYDFVQIRSRRCDACDGHLCQSVSTGGQSFQNQSASKHEEM